MNDEDKRMANTARKLVMGRCYTYLTNLAGELGPTLDYGAGYCLGTEALASLPNSRNCEVYYTDLKRRRSLMEAEWIEPWDLGAFTGYFKTIVLSNILNVQPDIAHVIDLLLGVDEIAAKSAQVVLNIPKSPRYNPVELDYVEKTMELLGYSAVYRDVDLLHVRRP